MGGDLSHVFSGQVHEVFLSPTPIAQGQFYTRYPGALLSTELAISYMRRTAFEENSKIQVVSNDLVRRLSYTMEQLGEEERNSL